MSGPPTRWRDDGSAPPHLRALVKSGLPSRPMPAGARERSARRLDRLVVVPMAAGLLLWLKGVAIAGLCVAGGVATVRVVPVVLEVLRRPEAVKVWRSGASSPGVGGRATGAVVRPGASAPPPPPPVSLPLVPAVPTASVGVPEAHPLDRVVPVRASTSAATARQAAAPATAPAAGATSAPGLAVGLAPEGDVGSPPTPAVPEDGLVREAAILEEARAVLAIRPGAALAAVARHAAEFPEGRLRMERELLRLDALQRLGRYDDARTAGEALLERAHGSIYEGHVRAILDGLPSSEAP